MDRVDAVVIGAGVVGLAIARALAGSGRETLVLERERAIGQGVSSRSSEVLHAGLYYPTGSLKARLCVSGRAALVDYCRSRGIGHRLCGKLVVATSEAQVDGLRALHAQARANGVDALDWLDGHQARALEPALHAVAALASPGTGIVDSHGLMLALQGDLEAHGGQLALGSAVTAVRPTRQGFEVDAAGITLGAACVVNAAGLWVPAVAQGVEGIPSPVCPPTRFAKGHYFSLAGRSPFRHLVYPMPEPGGLGIHLTLDLAGQARFGPDVEWVEAPSPEALDYRVDERRGPLFASAIRRYWPGLPDGALVPAYSGVRPKIGAEGAGFADFRIDDRSAHGCAGLVQLFGVESPGLTSCLALADEVLRRLDG